MKNTMIIGLAAGMLLFFSCKNHKTEKDRPESSDKKEMPQDMSTKLDTLNMLNVSFISIGEGVDYESASKFKLFLDESAFKENLIVEEFRWGREGEIDYCMDFKKIDNAEKSTIITKVEDLMKSSKLIRLEYNRPCRNKR